MPTRLFKTYRYSRHTYGDDGEYGRRNILSVSFVATELKRVKAASATGLLAVTTLTTSGTTTLTPTTTEIATPRNVTVTLAGTTANIGAGNIVITGHNSEGALITENLAVTAATGGLLTGNKAFYDITTVAFPATTGSGVTASIGYGSKLGIRMRNLASMPIQLLKISSTGVESIEAAAATNFSTSDVSLNTVTPTTTPDGTIEFRVYVLNYKWAINPTNAQPDYGV